MQTRSQQKQEPITSLVPELPKVYTRKSDRSRKSMDAFSPIIPLHAETKVSEQIEKGKGKMIESERNQTSIDKEPTLSEMFKGGNRPQTRPWNKLRLNIKMKQNPKLEREFIDIDKTPQKDLIINK